MHHLLTCSKHFCDAQPTGVQQAAVDLEALISLALSHINELDKCCGDLQTNLTQLQTQHATTSKHLTAAKAASAKLQSELETARQDAAHTEQQLREDADRVAAQLQGERDRIEERLQRRVDELEQEQEYKTERTEALQREVRVLEKQNAGLSLEVERWSTAAQHAESEVGQLKAAVDRQSQLLAGTREELAGKAAQAEHLGLSLSDCRLQLAHAQEEADAARGQIRQLVAEQAAGRIERQRLEAEVMRLGQQGGWISFVGVHAEERAAHSHATDSNEATRRNANTNNNQVLHFLTRVPNRKMKWCG